MSERFHPRKPGSRRLVGRGGAALGRDLEPTMRARSDAGIFVRAPVNEIVPALGPWPGVVGNLVGRKPRACTDCLCRIVEGAAHVVVGYDELASRMQRGKRRVLLDGELIKRKMLSGLGERAFELGRPRPQGLIRARVDQIEGIALENGARQCDRSKRLLR